MQSDTLGWLSIIALSPLFIYYGQQARPYALIALLSAMQLLAFLRVLEDPGDRRRVAIWAAVSAILLYAQYLALLVIAIQIGVALYGLRSGRIRILGYGLAVSALVLPWIIAAMATPILAGRDPLPQIDWMAPPTVGDFKSFYLSIFGEGPGIWSRWLLLILAIPGVAYLRRLTRSRNVTARDLCLIGIGAGIPVLVFALSRLGPKPIFAPRQLLGAAIAFVDAVAVCSATLPRVLAPCLILLLLAWTATSLPQAFPHTTKPPWREIAGQLDREHGSREVVAQEDWVSEPLEYYRKAGPVRLESAVSENDLSRGFLFMCRPGRCSNVETGALASYRTKLASWRWGLSELLLYEVASRSNTRR